MGNCIRRCLGDDDSESHIPAKLYSGDYPRASYGGHEGGGNSSRPSPGPSRLSPGTVNTSCPSTGSVTVVGFEAFARDLAEFETTNEVPGALSHYVSACEATQRLWFMKLLAAWKQVNPALTSAEAVGVLLIETLQGCFDIFDIQGLLRFYQLPCPSVPVAQPVPLPAYMLETSKSEAHVPVGKPETSKPKAHVPVGKLETSEPEAHVPAGKPKIRKPEVHVPAGKLETSKTEAHAPIGKQKTKPKAHVPVIEPEMSKSEAHVPVGKLKKKKPEAHAPANKPNPSKPETHVPTGKQKKKPEAQTLVNKLKQRKSEAHVLAGKLKKRKPEAHVPAGKPDREKPKASGTWLKTPKAAAKVQYEIHTLPVIWEEDQGDGDGFTVFVNVHKDAREAGLLPKAIQDAALLIHKARAQKNNKMARALKKQIKAANYKLFDGVNGEAWCLARKYRIRLRGVDAPEIEQPYGEEARDLLRGLVKDQQLVIRVYDTDKYERKVGDIYCNGMFIQAVLLKKGSVWHLKHFGKRKNFAKWERAAKESRLGLWANPNPEAPWDYRKRCGNRGSF